MGSTRDTLEAHRLMLELSVPGPAAPDLGALAARLAQALARFPRLQLRPAAEILLWNPARRLVPVAAAGRSLGATARSELQRRLELRAGRPDPFFAGRAEDRRLALPMVLERRSLGCLLVDPADIPSRAARNLLKTLAWVVSGVVHRQLLDEALQVREVELETAHMETIHRLGAASEVRDHETGWHVLRMAHYAKATARAFGLDAEAQERILLTAPMHDIGKLGIPDAILQKQGRLTPAEAEVMRTHPAIGGRILAGEDPLLQAAGAIAAAHHEHWDRSGYPNRLGGEEIPVPARICAVADVFDALTTARPYKPPWSLGRALEEIRAGAGSRFDPAVVDAFLEALPEILRIRQLFRDEVIDPNEVLGLPPLAPVAGPSGWDDSLSVGIEAIDAHHRFLFGLVGDLAAVVRQRRGAREAARVLRALDLYASIHFQAEERMMRQHGFRGVDRHARLHAAFSQRLRGFHAEMHENPLTAPWDILLFLQDWLVTHIRDEDTRLRALVG